MPMYSTQRLTQSKWKGPEITINHDHHGSYYNSSSSSDAQTPSPLDGSFNGLLLFDAMDSNILKNSFSLYDCGEEPTNKNRKVLLKNKYNKKNDFHILRVEEDDSVFNSPPKSIIRCPEEEFTPIHTLELKRPQPMLKQRARAASDTSPFNKSTKVRTRSNTVCMNKSQSSEDSRRRRVYSNDSDSSDNCAYCKSIGKEYLGHTKQKCPRIGLLDPCKLCGAAGYENHTATHCPSSTKVYLKLDPAFSEKLRKAQEARAKY